jgi:hypothetical protein
MTDAQQLDADRAIYRSLRASCARHDAGRFDEIAGSIVHELRDGEEATPGMWIQAARIIYSEQDYA